jgi:hypothetical protein
MGSDLTHRAVASEHRIALEGGATICRRCFLVRAGAGSPFVRYLLPSESIVVVGAVSAARCCDAASENSGAVTPPPGPGLACELEGDQLTFVVPARVLRRD